MEYIISYGHDSKKIINPVPDTNVCRDYYLLYLESVHRNKEVSSVLEKFNKNLFGFNVEMVEKGKNGWNYFQN